MPPSPRRLAHPTRQARSEATLRRLLDAAERVLQRRGWEGATVPAIAREARVAVGTVYKRFPDKDALLRLVYERFFERSRERNRAALDPACCRGVGLAALVRGLVSGMVTAYEENAALLSALYLYADTHRDAAFRRRAEALRREAFEGIGKLLLERRGEIRHPDPARAVRTALLVVAAVLRVRVGLGARWAAGGGPPPEELQRELARMALAYLGAGRD